MKVLENFESVAMGEWAKSEAKLREIQGELSEERGKNEAMLRRFRRALAQRDMTIGQLTNQVF